MKQSYLGLASIVVFVLAMGSSGWGSGRKQQVTPADLQVMQERLNAQQKVLFSLEAQMPALQLVASGASDASHAQALASQDLASKVQQEMQDVVSQLETVKVKVADNISHVQSLPFPQRDLTPVEWRRIQAALAVRGFDPGPSDGRLGAQTEGAIK